MRRNAGITGGPWRATQGANGIAIERFGMFAIFHHDVLEEAIAIHKQHGIKDSPIHILAHKAKIALKK